jgi:formylglycine-generating enzyme required for sulfatase activity
LTASERNAGRLPADWEYALPSPEQWEHAARAGTQGERYFADAALVRHANFADRSLLETEDDFYLYADGNLNDGAAQLAPVGSYLSNAWGLHDVYGNVWELTDSGVLCGGGWTSPPGYCRASVRKPALQFPADYVGLRIVVRPARPNPARSERSLE